MEGSNGQERDSVVQQEFATAQVAAVTFRLATKIVEIRSMTTSLRASIASAQEVGCSPDVVHKAMIEIVGDDEDLQSALHSIIRAELEHVQADIIQRLADRLGISVDQIGIIAL